MATANRGFLKIIVDLSLVSLLLPLDLGGPAFFGIVRFLGIVLITVFVVWLCRRPLLSGAMAVSRTPGSNGSNSSSISCSNSSFISLTNFNSTDISVSNITKMATGCTNVYVSFLVVVACVRGWGGRRGGGSASGWGGGGKGDDDFGQAQRHQPGDDDDDDDDDDKQCLSSRKSPAG